MVVWYESSTTDRAIGGALTFTVSAAVPVHCWAAYAFEKTETSVKDSALHALKGATELEGSLTQLCTRETLSSICDIISRRIDWVFTAASSVAIQYATVEAHMTRIAASSMTVALCVMPFRLHQHVSTCLACCATNT